MRTGVALLLAGLAATSCGKGEEGRNVADTISLTSPAFEDGGTIPTAHTCAGEKSSPPLSWSGIPDGAEALVLVVGDPDAPGGTFTHWVVTSIDPASDGVEEGDVPEGGEEVVPFVPPCPPRGDQPHRYVFTLFALSEDRDLPGGIGADEARDAVADVAVARGTLTGRFAL